MLSLSDRISCKFFVPKIFLKTKKNHEILLFRQRYVIHLFMWCVLAAITLGTNTNILIPIHKTLPNLFIPFTSHKNSYIYLYLNKILVKFILANSILNSFILQNKVWPQRSKRSINVWFYFPESCLRKQPCRVVRILYISYWYCSIWYPR